MSLYQVSNDEGIAQEPRDFHLHLYDVYGLLLRVQQVTPIKIPQSSIVSFIH
jgi:hypothetical protein